MPLAFLLVAAAAAAPSVADPLADLSGLCAQAFEGRLEAGDPAQDRDFVNQRLVMHMIRCAPDAVDIPFHVGGDRSRTWQLRRTAAGFQLKHRHLKPDGAPDPLTGYGGDHVGPVERLDTGGWRLSFPADAQSKALFAARGIPQSSANVWAVEYRPGAAFTYELKRPGRHVRVTFDLSSQVPPPPPPWGDAPPAP